MQVFCMHMTGLKLIPVPNKWTMAHGHLVVMGGICTADPSVEDDGRVDPRGPVLTFEQYTKTKERGRLDRKLRKISEEYIKDRSKSDILSKLICDNTDNMVHPSMYCSRSTKTHSDGTRTRYVGSCFSECYHLRVLVAQASGRPGADQDLLRN